MSVEYVLASGNKGKLAEFSAMLDPLGFVVHPQSNWDTPEAEESASTFVENALLKARNASEHTALPAIADDSGLVVPALNGAPGIYSARYAGAGASDQDNINKLLLDMEMLTGSERSAYFYCAIVLLEWAGDPSPLVATARWYGRILPVCRGDKGFGYDPVFAMHGSELSSAELRREQKQHVSHRGQALNLLLEQLRQRQGDHT